MSLHLPRKYVLPGLLILALGVGYGIYYYTFSLAVPEARDLRPFVHGKIGVPIVFTSRSEPTSLTAAAPEGEGFTYPGTIPWAAQEGRLRLLNPDGKVYELTWGRKLPDGGTLIDVMSPSVSCDGERILFAGRKASPDPGRWRIYEVKIDGSGLRQVTGGPDDAGCIALPPMRYAADGSLMSEDDRKRVDYDDVDPFDALGAIGFASSRIPDLGRDHARRATQVWLWTDGEPKPRSMTANRNNDRWPFLTGFEHLIIFSLWSRNREAVTEDGSEIRPIGEGGKYATGATDLWVGGRISLSQTQFGFCVKIPEPVWRPRPLFNGRVAFMTEHPAGGGRLRLAQADWGLLRIAPSSLAAGGRLPNQKGGEILYGPETDTDGRLISAACPSPCPGERMLFAAAPVGGGPGDWGLYTVSEHWAVGDRAVERLFDDPRLVDAEPVAIYRRPMNSVIHKPFTMKQEDRPAEFPLLSGRMFQGEFGKFDNAMVNVPAPDPFLGQETDTGEGPVIPAPTNVKSVVFYAARRDRFDDPTTPRVKGEWEKLMTAPVKPTSQGHLETWVPAVPGSASVLAGLDENGKVAKWSSPAHDSEGRSATFYAVAGDHYSGVRPNGNHSCFGCHTGHTFIPVDIRERAN